jgi:hypothetical protein
MATSEKSPVVACTLTPGDLAAQAARWLQLRSAAEVSRVETEDGFSLVLQDTPAVEAELRELVAVENGCCSWASWDVFRVDGALVMHASSTANGVDALHGMFVR